MRKLQTSLWAVGLTLLLSSCGGSGGQGQESFQVSSVLPSQLVPGEMVTVYGTLPKEAQLQLDGHSVTAVPVTGGLRFTLPADLLAGEHTLTVTASGRQLTSQLLVQPRLDAVALQGNTLLASGLGWYNTAATPARLVVQVDHQALPATVTTAGQLTVTLNRAAAYGVVPVQVSVNGQVSQTLNLAREAGAVKGKLALPAASSLTPLSAPPPPKTPQTSRHVLVSWQTTSELQALQEKLKNLPEIQALDWEPALQTVRLSFNTVAQAETALATLNQQTNQARFDPTIQLDGSERILTTAPRTHFAAQNSSQPSPEQWHLQALNIQEAWQHTQGEGVVVAVVDTGILQTHPDLSGRILPGFNFVEQNTDTNDHYGHGTHVAGLIAAQGKAFGVAPQAKLLPVKVLNDDSGGSSLNVARGILYAANLLPEHPNPNPASVINLSLGLPGNDSLIAEATQRVLSAGVLVVAATGNTGEAVASPANVPGVLAVGAVAGPSVPYVTTYSNWGPGISLMAYGGDLRQDQNHDGISDGILSTDVKDDGSATYGLRQGTSMAAPQVSGMVALLQAAGARNDLIPGLLQSHAQDLFVAGYDWKSGYGLVSTSSIAPAFTRTYLAALDSQNKVVAWSAVSPSGEFLLGNLPPGEPLSLLVSTDLNGNAVIGEVNEPAAQINVIQVQAAQVTSVSFPPLTRDATPQPVSLRQVLPPALKETP